MNRQLVMMSMLEGLTKSNKVFVKYICRKEWIIMIRCIYSIWIYQLYGSFKSFSSLLKWTTQSWKQLATSFNKNNDENAINK